MSAPVCVCVCPNNNVWTIMTYGLDTGHLSIKSLHSRSHSLTTKSFLVQRYTCRVIWRAYQIMWYLRFASISYLRDARLFSLFSYTILMKKERIKLRKCVRDDRPAHTRKASLKVAPTTLSYRTRIKIKITSLRNVPKGIFHHVTAWEV